MNFPEFAGNFALKQHLSGQVGQGRLFHAYILAGPPGSGKHTLARILAAAMVCDGGGIRPCGHCANCRKTFEGIHPDVIWAGRDETLLVAKTRALKGDAYIRPNEAERKVYIFENAQEMSDQAQDVLLKLLEEGPSYAAFLLLADNPAALLPTVRSRCELLTLLPVPPGEAEKALKSRFPDKPYEDVRAAAASCGGILGKAVSRLTGGERQEDAARTRARQLISCLSGRRELLLMEFAAGLDKCGRDEFSGFLDEAVSLLRDQLLLKTGFSRGGEPYEGDTLNERELMGTIWVLKSLREQCDMNVGVGHLAGLLTAGLWETVFEAKEELN